MCRVIWEGNTRGSERVWVLKGPSVREVWVVTRFSEVRIVTFVPRGHAEPYETGRGGTRMIVSIRVEDKLCSCLDDETVRQRRRLRRIAEGTHRNDWC